MMHVSVAEAKTSTDAAGAQYQQFDVHVNGAFHAAVRYSRLLRLHTALVGEYGASLRLPAFPPKKVRHVLSDYQLEQRRRALHSWLQALAQHAVTRDHPKVLAFFLDAQVESFRPTTTNISVDIYECDGSKHSIRCSIDCNTSLVLEIFCRSLGMNDENFQHFALFLANYESPKNCKLIRWLNDFESPYLSLQLLNQRSGFIHRIIVRKCLWDKQLELAMMSDPAAVNLLFSQAVSDVSSGSLPVSGDTLQRLRALQQSQARDEYVALCEQQAQYGCVRLLSCVADYPQPKTRVRLRVGQSRIVIDYADPANGEPVDTSFLATRIRIWKIVNATDADAPMQFQFEYLMARDHFEWITLLTDQAVLLSQCMQSMADELLGKKQKLPQQQQHVNGHDKTADEVPADASAASREQPTPPPPPPPPTQAASSQMANLAFAHKHKKAAAMPSRAMHNDAFNTITDDDL